VHLCFHFSSMLRSFCACQWAPVIAPLHACLPIIRTSNRNKAVQFLVFFPVLVNRFVGVASSRLYGHRGPWLMKWWLVHVLPFPSLPFPFLSLPVLSFQTSAGNS
jgi:hypothetical protein